MEYDDFVIQILPGQDDGYGVAVQSPSGSGEGRLGLTGLDPSIQESPAPTVTRDIRPVAIQAGLPSRSARTTGDMLFQALFQARVVRDLFFESLGGLVASGRGLRIRLFISPDLGQVQALPWELLYRAEADDYYGLSLKTPIVRSLAVPRSSPSSLVGDRLRILAVAPRPRGHDTLDLDRERHNLKAAWRWRWDAKIEFLRKPDFEDLHRVLEKGRFQVLHFMGHGTFEEGTGEGALLFEAPDGETWPVTGRDLATELKQHPGLQLVVLNACQSARMAAGDALHSFAGVASALVLGGVPAVVAMQSWISDPAAIAFSKTFYKSLADGDPVDTAITQGRQAIRRRDGEDGGWELPVLFLLAKEGNLFKDSVPAQGRSTLTNALRVSVAILIAILLFGFGFRKSYKALKLNNQGAHLLEEGRLDEARATLEAALRLDGGYAAVDANLAGVERLATHYNEALRYAEAAVEKAPGEAAYQYDLGNLLIEMGRYEEAIPKLTRARQLEPCHGAALNDLGRAYLSLGDPAEARRAVEAGLRCDHTTGPPARGPLLKNLGRAALAEKHPGEAAQHLEQGLIYYARERRQDLWEPTYLLAEAYAEAGHRDLACRNLRDFSHLAAAEVTPWARDAKLLARQQGCENIFQGG